jgi:multidrug resistance efflux pump
MESGNLEALRSYNIVNQIEGRTTIDYVVPEGTILTPEDVKKRTVLVRLNAADLDDKRVKQEIDVADAKNAFLAAQTQLEIQRQQNASDLRKAELDVRFARLDLERYVGKSCADDLQALAAGMAREDAGQATADAPAVGAATPADVAGPAPGGEDAAGARARQDLRQRIAGLLENPHLEGEALQQIRQFTSDIQLAEEKLKRAAEKVRQSERLESKGYYSREDLEADRLALEQSKIERERAGTARQQYVAYDFPKQVEQLLSNVVEALDSRARTIKKADAEEEQKRSAVDSRKKQWELKKRRLDSYVAQEASCVIRATRPGLIVYASSQSGHRWSNDDRIHEGATVRQGQALLTIPDAHSLGAIIKVHETAVDKVQEGLTAFVQVDALPGQRFRGRVTEVNRMPDAADRWLNPDLKVYTTKIQLLGDHKDLKPGMSAQVEILVTTLSDVLTAPVQAVAGTTDKPVVYVWKGGDFERRPVKLGMASEHFVEIRSGVKPGERLLLDPPREERPDVGAGDKGTAAKPDGPTPQGAPAAGAAPARRPGAHASPAGAPPAGGARGAAGRGARRGAAGRRRGGRAPGGRKTGGETSGAAR